MRQPTRFYHCLFIYTFFCLSVLISVTCAAKTARTGHTINNRNSKKSGLSKEQQGFLLDYHNEFRLNVSNGMMKKYGGGYMPTASDMFKMKWDSRLAASAQKYADKCIWGHDQQNDDSGENLATNTASSLKSMVDMWIVEIRDHRLTSIKKFAKKDLKKMGHATAMMWWNTDRLGCGLRRGCNFKFFNKTWTMNYLVCRYAPMGNIYDRRIYHSGRTCSHCKKYGKKCSKGLCVD